jgi:hypothetical protein
VSGTEPQHEDWLRRHAFERERPWALEEQLLGPSRPPEGERQLAALTTRIVEERIAVTRLQREVDERVERLADLETELHDLTAGASTPERLDDVPTVELGGSNGSDHEYWLCRCHGFRVEAGAHDVGIVEGVRYGSSATRPDMIEIRAGHFGRRSILVAVEDVEEILEEEETLLVRPSAVEGDDLARALLARLRGKFGHQVAT